MLKQSYISVFWPLIEVLASFAMALIVWYGGGRALWEGLVLVFYWLYSVCATVFSTDSWPIRKI